MNFSGEDHRFQAKKAFSHGESVFGGERRERVFGPCSGQSALLARRAQERRGTFGGGTGGKGRSGKETGGGGGTAARWSVFFSHSISGRFCERRAKAAVQDQLEAWINWRRNEEPV
jgi:hypothetical protein